MNALAWTLVAGAIAAGLAGCGGGGSSSSAQPTAQKGTFVDSAVGGLGYACGAFSGVTGANGSFDYEAGSNCSFKVGGVTIGSAPAAALITPVGLVSGAVDESNPTVVNITRFLLSLDADNNSSNGITIAGSVATALASATLDFTSASFDTQAAALVGSAISGRTLVSASQARAELGVTLLGLLAGSYNCTYTDVRPGGGGTASLMIAAGVITGSGVNSAVGSKSFTLTGNVTTSGGTTLVGGSASNGATFTGSFKNDGVSIGGSGTWKESPGNGSGTWACQKA